MWQANKNGRRFSSAIKIPPVKRGTYNGLNCHWQNSLSIDRPFVNCDFFSLSKQGWQMVYFQNNNPNFGKFRRALEWKMLVYFMSIWDILQRAIWYIYGTLVILWSFGIFFPFWYIVWRKIWQPCLEDGPFSWHWCKYIDVWKVNSSFPRDQGSMLLSQFSAVFAYFGRKNWRFFQKPMLWSFFYEN
jgi:hypothetical protein